MNKKNQKGNTRKTPRHYSTGDRFRLFVIYWLIFFVLILIGLFSVGQWLPGWLHWLLYLSSLVLAGVATYVHVTPGKKSKFATDKIEEFADELK